LGAIQYIRKNFDEAAILSVCAKLAFQKSVHFNDQEQAVIAALRRSSNEFRDADLDAIGQRLASLDDDQIAGLSSNVKGILHEMEFVRLENEDGDSVYASLFDNTNHPDVDVFCIDASTNDVWDLQLKATDDTHYVESWINDHPDGDILVTEELADALDLDSSGFSNEELTVRVEDVADKLIDSSEDDTIWSYFPYITAVSISLVVWELWKRYQGGQITLSRFKWMAASATGLKIGKIAVISALMMVPGLNVVVGAALLARLIHTARRGVSTVIA
jgi:hypothetical protein